MKLVATGGLQAAAKKVRLASGDIETIESQTREQQRINRESLRLLSENQQIAAQQPEKVLEQLRPFLSTDLEDATSLPAKEELDAVNRALLLDYGVFDQAFYRFRYLNNDPKAKPLEHYLNVGALKGYWPNSVFSPTEYLALYPEVANLGILPVLHYSLLGWKAGYCPGPHFDHEFYLRAYPDVAKSGQSPISHYLKQGQFEKRKPRFSGGAEVTGYGVFDPNLLPRNRGTIVIVIHDTEFGGAQQVAKIFAKWLVRSTQFEIKIISMRGGPQIESFQEIAPLFNFEGYERQMGEEGARRHLETWLGNDVVCYFVNSVASGRFFNVSKRSAPVISYIHEMPKIISLYGDYIHQVMSQSARVLTGSHAVRNSLISAFGLSEERSGVVYDYVEGFDQDMLVEFDEKYADKAALGCAEDAILVMGCGTVQWRKSPKLFIEVARKILSKSKKKVEFVWIGDGEDFNECVSLVASYGLSEKIRFVGHQTNLNPYFRACDVFLLPSEEDPFPLVCLYASIGGAPVVCFEDAGGMPEFMAMGAGQAVPFQNVEAMANATLEYINNPELRAETGKTGREIALENFTIKTTGPALLHAIREAAGIAPKVSVVVPNYNYEAFLPERLKTIQEQTYQDFDVILLDDASSDKSTDVLRKFAEHRPGTRCLFNEDNSGSPFAQWLKGMDASSADLLWMAEADDIATADLLESVLPALEDRNVFLSYGKSVPVNEMGAVIGDYEPIYLDRINQGRWSADYKCTDHQEMSDGLGIANCIPNASSVIMRKFTPEPGVVDSVTSLKLCGDWFFYIRAILGGEIAYCSKEVNFHRRHENSVTQRMEGSREYFSELSLVRSFIRKNFEQSKKAQAQITKFTAEDLDRFDIKDETVRREILCEVELKGGAKKLPSLGVVVADLAPGGGQIFAITLANTWMRMGGRAFLFNVGQLSSHPEVVKRIDSRVPLYDASNLPKPFEVMVEDLDINVVHSSVWWADRFVHDHYSKLKRKVAWIVSMHGCAETIIEDPAIDKTFAKRIPDMLKKVDVWAYTAEKNKQVFDIYGQPPVLEYVLNGIEHREPKPISKADIGVRKDALLLCLASRAIESKGWGQAVSITQKLNERGIKADLLLIGDGPEAARISALAPDHVHLIGQVSNLNDYIAACDIGLLPTYFVGESFPLIILEMLSLGKPVISTNVGKIPEIIGTDPATSSGYVIPLVQGLPDVDGFVKAISELQNASRRKAVGQRALQKFEENYTAEQMAARFRKLYAASLNPKVLEPQS